MITNILEDELVLEMTEDIEARQHTLLGRLNSGLTHKAKHTLCEYVNATY